MGQAKLRGTFEERKAQGIERRLRDNATRALRRHPDWAGATPDQREAAVQRMVDMWQGRVLPPKPTAPPDGAPR